MSFPPLFKNLRRVAIGCAALACLAVTALALVEHALELRDEQALAGTETFAQVGGAKVRYKLIEPADPAAQKRPTIVFLNGGGGTIEQWDRLQAAAMTVAPMLAYDRGGTGFSSGSKAYDAWQQAGELADLLSVLRIDRVVLVAYSFSGSLARVFAGRHRDKLAGMLLLDPYLPELEQRMVGGRTQLRLYVRPLVYQTVTTFLGLKRFFDFLEERRTHPPVDLHERRVRAVLERFQHAWAVDREILTIDEITRQVIAAGGLTDLPLVVLTASTFPNPAAVPVLHALQGELAARSSKGSQRYLAGVDHATLLDDPRAIRSAVEALRELTAPLR